MVSRTQPLDARKQKLNPHAPAETAHARSQRGAGVPAHSRSHYVAILELLGERGSQRVLGSELYAGPEVSGRSPRNRISELRRDGYVIEGRPHGASDWWYWLVRDNAGAKPDSSDWYEREHGPRPSGHPWKSAFSEKRLAQDDCFQLTPPEVRR